MRRILLVVAVTTVTSCRCHLPVDLPDDPPDPVLREAAGTDASTADAGTDEGADAGLDAGIASSGFCAAYVAAWCGWAERCGKVDPPQRADCEQLMAWICDQRLYDVAVGSRKLLFDAS